MITLQTAEQIAKSKVALIIILLLAISGLSACIVRLSNKNDKWESDYKLLNQVHKVEIREKDSVIYNRDEQIKIIQDLATTSAQAQAQEFKGLWMEYANFKSQIRNVKNQ